MTYLVISGAIGFALGGWEGAFFGVVLVIALAALAAKLEADRLSRGKSRITHYGV